MDHVPGYMLPLPVPGSIPESHCLGGRCHHDPLKVQKVQEWPTPTSAQEVPQFIGLASCYCHFVKDVATVAKLLHALTKKYPLFQCTMPGSVQQTQACCLLLCQCWFTHWTNARWFWTLMQVTLALVPYCRRFSNAQLELLAVVEFTSHFWQYLLGRAFIVCSDHSSLRWLTRMNETEGHLARRLERFGAYNFEIIYRPGWLHSNADSLSRKTSPRSCPCRLPSPPPCPESIGLQLMRCQQHSVVGQAT